MNTLRCSLAALSAFLLWCLFGDGYAEAQHFKVLVLATIARVLPWLALTTSWSALGRFLTTLEWIMLFFGLAFLGHDALPVCAMVLFLARVLDLIWLVARSDHEHATVP